MQVQRFSPVGAYIQPTAGATPGYGDEVSEGEGMVAPPYPLGSFKRALTARWTRIRPTGGVC